MGEPLAITRLQASPAVSPSSLAHFTLGLLVSAPHHSFVKEGSTCTAPYLSHEVLLKCLLLEGFRLQAICKGKQGSAWTDLARPLTLALPFPACEASGLSGTASAHSP